MHNKLYACMWLLISTFSCLAFSHPPITISDDCAPETRTIEIGCSAGSKIKLLRALGSDVNAAQCHLRSNNSRVTISMNTTLFKNGGNVCRKSDNVFVVEIPLKDNQPQSIEILNNGTNKAIIVMDCFAQKKETPHIADEINPPELIHGTFLTDYSMHNIDLKKPLSGLQPPPTN